MMSQFDFFSRWRRRPFPWLALCLIGASAMASPLMASPGDGIRLGGGNVSPSIGLELGFDTNPLRRNVDYVGTGFLDVRPALDLNYRASEFRARLSYNHLARFFLSEGFRPLSFGDDLALNGQVVLFPSRKIGFTFRDSFSSRNYLRRDELEAAADLGLLDRQYNLAEFETRYSPGSALDLFLALRYYFDLQDITAGDDPSPLKNDFGIGGRGRWKFFPRTSLIVETKYRYGRWSNLSNCTESTGCTSDLAKSPTVAQFTALAGLGGQFTDTLEANVFLGYGGLNNLESAEAENISGLAGLLGQTQVIFRPAMSHSLSASYLRSFIDAALLDYSLSNTFLLSYSGRYASRLGVDVNMGIDFRTLDSAEIDEAASREERALSGSLRLEYAFFNWLTASGSFQVSNVDAFESQTYSYGRSVFYVGVRGVY